MKTTKEQIEIIKLEKGIQNIDFQMERTINEINEQLETIEKKFCEITDNINFLATVLNMLVDERNFKNEKKH